MPAPRGPYIHAVEHKTKAWLSGTVEPCSSDDWVPAASIAFNRLSLLAAELRMVPAFVRVYVDAALPLDRFDRDPGGIDLSAVAGSIVAARLGGRMVELETEGGETAVTSEKLDGSPFAAAARAGDTVYLSAQIGISDSGEDVVQGGARVEAQQIFTNLQKALRSLDLDLSSIVKTTLYLIDLHDFEVVNEVYRSVFADRPVARTTLGVSGLPGSARVQIDAIAVSAAVPTKEEHD